MQVEDVKGKVEIKSEVEDEYTPANNTTVSSCDYSLSQFKDEPLSELQIEEESGEEDIPLVRIITEQQLRVLS